MLMLYVWAFFFWQGVFDEWQHAATDAYWQAEYESVCRELNL
jgi:hypothetical protein